MIKNTLQGAMIRYNSVKSLLQWIKSWMHEDNENNFKKSSH